MKEGGGKHLYERMGGLSDSGRASWQPEVTAQRSAAQCEMCVLSLRVRYRWSRAGKQRKRRTANCFQSPD